MLAKVSGLTNFEVLVELAELITGSGNFNYHGIPLVANIRETPRRKTIFIKFDEWKSEATKWNKERIMEQWANHCIVKDILDA